MVEFCGLLVGGSNGSHLWGRYIPQHSYRSRPDRIAGRDCSERPVPPEVDLRILRCTPLVTGNSLRCAVCGGNSFIYGITCRYLCVGICGRGLCRTQTGPQPIGRYSRARIAQGRLLCCTDDGRYGAADWLSGAP